MTDGLDAAIRARVRALGDWDDVASKLAGALLVVLDLHKPKWEPYGYVDRGQWTCAGETQPLGDFNQYTDYPCETVEGIAKALGIEVG